MPRSLVIFEGGASKNREKSIETLRVWVQMLDVRLQVTEFSEAERLVTKAASFEVVIHPAMAECRSLHNAQHKPVFDHFEGPPCNSRQFHLRT